MNHLFATARLALLLIATALQFSPVATAAERQLAAKITEDYAYLGPLFEHFHANPELSFVEHETAKRLARELRAAGVEVSTGIGGTGVVGVLRNGDGPVLLLRADMDGLPVEEKSGLPYASKVRQVDIDGNEFPVMHACGHDVHMTVLVGTARRLMAMRDAWRGTVVLIGQPAEERISGARRMLEDGLYERFPRPDHALALHVSSSLPSGQILIQPGLTFSSSDSIDIVVHGVGTHGASPHQGKDPIVIASQIVLALQTLVAREISPLRPGVVTVGAFHSGTKHNIISDRAELQLTVRSDDDETRDALLTGIERIAEGIGRAAGLPDDKLPEVIRSTQSTPPTLNDPALTQRLRDAFAEYFGAARLTEKPREGMGAEDFAYFLRTEPRVPGVYFRVGGTPTEAFRLAAAGGPAVAGHHSPYFKIEPETSIITGVEAMTVAVLELLGR